MVVEIGNSCCDTRAIRAPGIRVRALRQQSVTMGERSGIDRSRRGIGGKRRRHRSLGDVDLAFREIREGRCRHSEVLRQHLGRRVPDPIADAEGAELGEITVVEHQHEQAVLGADALDRVTEAAREVPYVAGGEVGDLRLAFRVDGGDPALALDHIGPFRRIGVPVQLAQPARERATSARRRAFPTPEIPPPSLLSPSRRPRTWARPHRAGSGTMAVGRRPAPEGSARTAVVPLPNHPCLLRRRSCPRPPLRLACRAVRIRTLFIPPRIQSPTPDATDRCHSCRWRSQPTLARRAPRSAATFDRIC